MNEWTDYQKSCKIYFCWFTAHYLQRDRKFLVTSLNCCISLAQFWSWLFPSLCWQALRRSWITLTISWSTLLRGEDNNTRWNSSAVPSRLIVTLMATRQLEQTSRCKNSLQVLVVGTVFLCPCCFIMRLLKTVLHPYVILEHLILKPRGTDELL